MATYTFKIKAYGDFSPATVPRMVTQVYAGPRVGVLTADWHKTAKGWRVSQRDFNLD